MLFRSYDSNTFYNVFIDTRSAVGGEAGMGALVYTGGSLYMWSDGAGSDVIVCQTPNFMQSGVWYHVILTVDEDSCAIYVDGKNLVNGSGTAQGDLFPQTDNDIHVGGRYDAITGYDYKGRIENFMFFNQTVTEADVDKMYWLTNGQPTPPTYLEIGRAHV